MQSYLSSCYENGISLTNMNNIDDHKFTSDITNVFNEVKPIFSFVSLYQHKTSTPRHYHEGQTKIKLQRGYEMHLTYQFTYNDDNGPQKGS